MSVCILNVWDGGHILRWPKWVKWMGEKLLLTSSFFFFNDSLVGLLWWLSGHQRICLLVRRHKRSEFDPWVGKIPWSRKWQPTPIFLPGKSPGQRSLVGYSPWDHTESDMTLRHSAHNGKLIQITSCISFCIHSAVISCFHWSIWRKSILTQTFRWKRNHILIASSDPLLWERGLEKYFFMGTEFQYEMIKKFWR